MKLNQVFEKGTRSEMQGTVTPSTNMRITFCRKVISGYNKKIKCL